jgi:IS5 family transposase
MKKKIAAIGEKINSIFQKCSSVSIKIQENHPLVLVTAAVNWDEYIKKVEEIRQKKLKRPHVGRSPHLRQMIGAVILRALKRCTLQEAMDLMRHYAPARILCGFIDEKGVDSGWTPDFRTLSDFEALLGADGIAELTADLLRSAKDFGFTDSKTLCSDTTAQEASIPYPTEVGLMSSFAKSIQSMLQTVKTGSVQLRDKAISTIEDIAKKVREYRLFAKTPERKQKVTKSLLRLTKSLHATANQLATEMKAVGQNLSAKGKRASNRLKPLLESMSKLMPQIKYFIKHGKPTSNKIISLSHPEVRSVVRGKTGKETEFGLKWLVNRLQGGYVWLHIHASLQQKSDFDYAVQAIDEHIALFGEPPKEFGFDRGGWSEPHIQKIKNKGVKRVAIAPKGKAKWKVSDRCRKRMIKERSQVEGSIGCMKRTGFNKPQTKNTQGMLKSAQRAGLRLNLMNLVRDVKNAMAA